MIDCIKREGGLATPKVLVELLVKAVVVGLLGGIVVVCSGTTRE